MDFNVNKTQFIIYRYSNTELPRIPNIRLRGESFKLMNTIKYLGILFSSNMKFSEHISSITTKGKQLIAALRRKLGRHCSPSVFKVVYEACVRSILEYGSNCWDPINKTDIDKLESVNRFAMRHYVNKWNLSENELFEQTKWSTLAQRRHRLKVIQLYKFYRGYHDYSYHFTKVIDSGRRFSSRTTQPHWLTKPSSNTAKSFDQCFNYSAISLWNQLDSETGLCDNLVKFKKMVNEFNFA